MRRLHTLCLFVAALALGPSTATAQTVTWAPAWADEFDGPALNHTIWSAPDGDDPLGWSFADGVHAFRPEKVAVAGGYLTITTAREEYYPGWPYTSGAVHTLGKRVFGPGDFRVDIRARLPKGAGIWPALWAREGTMPTPNTGLELDLVETLGQQPSRSYLTSHVWNNGTHVSRPAACEWLYTDTSAGFVTYSLERVGNVIRWAINGVERCRQTTAMPTLAHYLILDVAVGGSWAGLPTAQTVFPVQMQVDYVRVYRNANDVPPVDAVVSDWSDWSASSAWSACVGGQQTRTETRTRTVLVPAQGAGVTPPLSETRTVTQACVTPPQPLPTVTLAVRTCTLTFSATATPDGSTGWGVQYRTNGTAFGTRDTTSPFTATGSVNAGSLALTAYWTKTGATAVTQSMGTVVCE